MKQHAFITKHSTNNNLLETTHDWSVLLNRNHPVDVLNIDFQKTFDSVIHAKLLYTLTSCCLPDSLTSSLSAFLTNRSQQVAVERVLSQSSAVIREGHQGSFLGQFSLVYLLHLNTLLAREASFNCLPAI